MVGAMLAVVAHNLALGAGALPPEFKIVLQLVSGAMIGSKVGRKDVAEVRGLVFPALFLLGAMVALNLVFGWLVFSLSALDVATALFAVAPGGMTDMALISADLGANTFYVAILQLFRILVILTVMPPVFRRIVQKRAAVTPGGEPVAAPPEDELSADPPVEEGPWRWSRLLPAPRFWALLAAAVAGGLLFNLLGVVAGALTGAMLAAGIFSVARGKTAFPDRLKVLLQLFSGIFVGSGIDRDSLTALPQLAVPALIMMVGIFAFTFSTAFLLHRLFKLDLAVCLLSSTPGGVQEMALLSEDLGADTPKIAILQTTRLVCVILFFPTMLRLIVGLAGG